MIVDVDVDNGFYMDRQGRSFGDDPFVVDGLGRATPTVIAGPGSLRRSSTFPTRGRLSKILIGRIRSR